jgi:Asp-tRNA(Asn)/Glu-tRNA(Gln) amidotransferase A subunit family amidase
MGYTTEPGTEDFNRVTKVFDKAVAEFRAAGATVVDPIEIPNLIELLATRANSPAQSAEVNKTYLARNPNSPLKSTDDIIKSPEYDKVFPLRKQMLSGGSSSDTSKHYKYMQAREELMIAVMKVMADNKLDAIVHKSVEHSPTLISEGIKPPYVNQKGAPHLNTFLIYTASVTVPAGFTDQNLPVGITFFGRAYSEPVILKIAYAYEQATHHRIPPKTTPALTVLTSNPRGSSAGAQ